MVAPRRPSSIHLLVYRLRNNWSKIAVDFFVWRGERPQEYQMSRERDYRYIQGLLTKQGGKRYRKIGPAFRKQFTRIPGFKGFMSCLGSNCEDVGGLIACWDIINPNRRFPLLS